MTLTNPQLDYPLKDFYCYYTNNGVSPINFDIKRSSSEIVATATNVNLIQEQVYQLSVANLCSFDKTK